MSAVATGAPPTIRPPLGLPIGPAMMSRILELWKRGQGVDTAAIAAEVERHEADVQRVITDDREARRAGRGM